MLLMEMLCECCVKTVVANNEAYTGQVGNYQPNCASETAQLHKLGRRPTGEQDLLQPEGRCINGLE